MQTFNEKARSGWRKIIILCASALVIGTSLFTSRALAAQANPLTPQVSDVVQELRSQDFDEALRLADIALKKTPQDARLWTLRGMAYAGKGATDSALNAYQHALLLQPAYLPALEGAAQIEFQRNDPSAKHLLRQILAQRPDDPTSHAMLGFFEYREKNCSDAVSDFEKGSQALARQPDALGAYGSCLVLLNRYEDSVPVFQQALALEPDNTRLRMNLAIAQWKADQTAAALSTLQPLIESSSSNENALLLASSIYESANDTAHAVELLRKAILKNPKDVDAYLAFAELSFDHASMQVGIDILNAGLTQLPHEARLYLARGVLHAQLGNFSQATDDFETANQLDASLSFAGVAEGLVQSQEHRGVAALNSFEAAAKAHPNDALTQYLLAEALSEEGKTQEAIASGEAAVHIAPKMVTAHDLLASLYLQKQQSDLAIAQSRAALALDPKDQQAIYHLILALRSTPQKDQIPALLKQLTALRAAVQSEGMQKKRYKLEEMPVSASVAQ